MAKAVTGPEGVHRAAACRHLPDDAPEAQDGYAAQAAVRATDTHGSQTAKGSAQLRALRQTRYKLDHKAMREACRGKASSGRFVADDGEDMSKTVHGRP